MNRVFDRATRKSFTHHHLSSSMMMQPSETLATTEPEPEQRAGCTTWKGIAAFFGLLAIGLGIWLAILLTREKTDYCATTGSTCRTDEQCKTLCPSPGTTTPACPTGSTCRTDEQCKTLCPSPGTTTPACPTGSKCRTDAECSTSSVSTITASASENANLTLSCPADKRATISRASFAGTRNPSCTADVRAKIPACSLGNCTVPTNISVLGDPCPGDPKVVSVTYSCT